MSKNFAYAELFDIYGNLLTDRQKEIFSSFYLEDLSLGEIAENLGITRQSVLDSVKKSENQLVNYEEAMKISERNKKLSEVLQKIKEKDGALYDELLSILGK